LTLVNLPEPERERSTGKKRQGCHFDR